MLKRWLGLVAAGAILLLAAVSSASGEVAVPPLKAHVTDLTATLSGPQIQDLESRLAGFERGKGSQIVVLMLPSTQPETIEAYSIRLAEAWKIGRARAEDGVILVVAKNDRKLRFEVGTGLEGAIPDVIARRIVSDVIAPHFGTGDFYGGIAAGTDAVMKLIEGEGLPAPPSGVFIKGVHHAIDFQTIFLLFVVLVLTDAIFRRLFGRVIGAGISGGIVGAIVWVAARRPVALRRRSFAAVRRIASRRPVPRARGGVVRPFARLGHRAQLRGLDLSSACRPARRNRRRSGHPRQSRDDCLGSHLRRDAAGVRPPAVRARRGARRARDQRFARCALSAFGQRLERAAGQARGAVNA